MPRDIHQAKHLTGAYRASIELFERLQDAGLRALGEDALEIRSLIFTELVNLYVETSDPMVRQHLNEVGLGPRLVEEARILLRQGPSEDAEGLPVMVGATSRA